MGLGTCVDSLVPLAGSLEVRLVTSRLSLQRVQPCGQVWGKWGAFQQSRGFHGGMKRNAGSRESGHDQFPTEKRNSLSDQLF